MTNRIAELANGLDSLPDSKRVKLFRSRTDGIGYDNLEKEVNDFLDHVGADLAKTIWLMSGAEYQLLCIVEYYQRRPE